MRKLVTFLCVIVLSMSFLVGCGSYDLEDTGIIADSNYEEYDEETETVEEDTYNDTLEEAENFIEGNEEAILEEAIEEVAENKVEYTYSDMNETMYSTTNLNVRSLPSSDGEKIGSFSNGEAVEVTGKCNETGWLRVKYRSQEGYVSDSYMSSEKPVVQTPVTQTKEKNSSEQQPTPQPSSSGGTVWISATGSKYHSINNCGKMNPSKATQVSEAEAISRGLGKCSKCW